MDYKEINKLMEGLDDALELPRGSVFEALAEGEAIEESVADKILEARDA